MGRIQLGVRWEFMGITVTSNLLQIIGAHPCSKQVHIGCGFELQTMERVNAVKERGLYSHITAEIAKKGKYKSCGIDGRFTGCTRVYFVKISTVVDEKKPHSIKISLILLHNLCQCAQCTKHHEMKLISLCYNDFCENWSI